MKKLRIILHIVAFLLFILVGILHKNLTAFSGALWVVISFIILLDEPEITREQFIEEYCKNSDITWEELQKTNICLPCKCSDPYCQGWAMVTIDPISIKAHNDLYYRQ